VAENMVFVAECFWTGVSAGDLAALDERAQAFAARTTRQLDQVRYLGSLLMREDEVVLCFFEGSEASVRQAAEGAEIPFDRILETTGSAVPLHPRATDDTPTSERA
jgi:Protein of unknown function (DUF4242)